MQRRNGGAGDDVGAVPLAAIGIEVERPRGRLVVLTATIRAWPQRQPEPVDRIGVSVSCRVNVSTLVVKPHLDLTLFM